VLVTASSNVRAAPSGPWVSESEVQRVVEAWRAQGGRRESVIALDVPAGRGGSMGGGSSDDDDEILAQARDTDHSHRSPVRGRCCYATARRFRSGRSASWTNSSKRASWPPATVQGPQGARDAEEYDEQTSL